MAPLGPCNVLDVSCVATPSMHVVVPLRSTPHRLLCAMYWPFHVLRQSRMKVVVPLCFAYHRLPPAMYWAFHVSRSATLLYFVSTL